MPEFSVQTILFVVCVGLFTLAAAAWDLRSRRIPNKLTVPVFLLGLVYQATFGGWAGLADAGAAFGVGFGTLFVLWLVGGGGGGDVKMMGALSVWLGFHMTVLVMIASTVFVLAGSVGVVLWSFVSAGLFASVRRIPKHAVATATDADEHSSIIAEATDARRNRRVMAYALPVALATWLVVIWKLPMLS